ncbi:hypothetical protein B8A33_02805 [Dolosigranulum pigrum]|uniref:hypothetical protein n=1 Tax=Dolosigranulum pigrum TaxID=29394 RepID=UPI000DBF7129|nr:hypothetical protein [Dolosigranulum pigrum]RAN57093.1 hypothetical protein B8A33_02805 [Dolosigranulum pigrum]
MTNRQISNNNQFDTEQSQSRVINCPNCLAATLVTSDEFNADKELLCHHCKSKLPDMNLEQAFDMSNKTWEIIRQERLEYKSKHNGSTTINNNINQSSTNTVQSTATNDSSGIGCGCLFIIIILIIIFSIM